MSCELSLIPLISVAEPEPVGAGTYEPEPV